jgi:hypothetical protein
VRLQRRGFWSVQLFEETTESSLDGPEETNTENARWRKNVSVAYWARPRSFDFSNNLVEVCLSETSASGFNKIAALHRSTHLAT